MLRRPGQQPLPARAPVPQGWAMVWLPRPGEFGFSGGWRSFALDMVSAAGRGCPWHASLPKLLQQAWHERHEPGLPRV